MLDMLGAVGEWRGIGKRGNRRGRDLPQGVGICSKRGKDGGSERDR